MTADKNRFDQIPLTLPVSNEQFLDWQIEADRAQSAEVWSVDELLKRPIQG